MNNKIDLVYDIVSKIDERQRTKALEDAARHASEDAWRKQVDAKLESHKGIHSKTDKRLKELEETSKIWAWFHTRTGKIGAGVTGLISTAYAIYKAVS